jgi:hypothetical protein
VLSLTLVLSQAVGLTGIAYADTAEEPATETVVAPEGDGEAVQDADDAALEPVTETIIEPATEPATEETPAAQVGATGSYPVTFTTVGNVTVTPDSPDSDARGNLHFVVRPAPDNTVVSITTTPSATNPAYIALTDLSNYVVHGVSAATTVTVTALATPSGETWADYADTSWYDSTLTTFTLTTAEQLAGLGNLVNKGISDFSGVTIKLGADIDLEDHLWLPIGGQCSETGPIPSGVPDGPYFNGTFNGSDDGSADGHTIDNMYIAASGINASTMSGYGFIGATHGNIANLNVNGNIILAHDAAYTGEIHYAGAIVGYTEGSVYNCQAVVNINALRGANFGGVAGGLQNTSRETVEYPSVVAYCTATGNISGAFEVGGIVGGAYCQIEGNIRVGYSSYTGGVCSTTNSGSQSYVAGIIGYTKGYAAYTYANGVMLGTQGGHYEGGASGRASGNTPLSSYSNSYTNVLDYDGGDPGYCRPFIPNMDGSSILPIKDCVWTQLGNYTQPSGAGWGTWSGGTGPVALADLNAASTLVTLGTNFVQGSGDHPVLDWEANGRVYLDPTDPDYDLLDIPGGTNPYPIDSDDHTMIFLNAAVPDGGVGTYADPTNSLSVALGLLDSTRNTIYIKNVAVNPDVPISSTVEGATIMRSSLYDGYLFFIDGTEGPATVSNIIVDGNRSAFEAITPTESLFYVADRGNLTVEDGAILRNNYAGDGGAISVAGSGSSMTGGEIINNKSQRNAGAIALHRGAKFTLLGGVIGGSPANGNEAVNEGGAIALYNNSELTIAGGTITYNTAGAGGNGIYCDSMLTLSPSGTTAFEVTDEIVLAENSVPIFVETTLANIHGDLNIRTETASAAGTVIANGSNFYTLTSADTQKMYYVATTDDYSVVPGQSNTAVLAASLFLDGSAAAGGDGSRQLPFNNVASALYVANSTQPIIVIGNLVPIALDDLDLYGGSYEGAVFRRGLGYTGVLFSVSDRSSLSGVQIKGTAQYVPNATGALMLLDNAKDLLIVKRGTVLEYNHATNGAAIDIEAGSVNILAGMITNNTASGNGNGIYLSASTDSSLSIEPATDGLSFGSTDYIYLATGKVFTIGGSLSIGLSSNLYIQCEDPSDGRIIAQGTSGYTLTDPDAAKCTYTPGGYDIIYNNSNNTLELLES